jgi:magnesium chelatase subunit H
MHVVLVTMDSHLAGAALRAQKRLDTLVPGVRLTVHCASEWAEAPDSLQACRRDISQAHLVIVTMLFMEDHFLPVLDALEARREHCDAMVCVMSAAEVMRLTRMGRFTMESSGGGPMAWIKRLRGASKTSGGPPSSGASQMRMLRRLPQWLRFIPGGAQDLRAYLLTLQYWLAGSESNIAHMVHMLVDRYAAGAREVHRGRHKVMPPVEYPEVGVYHPRMQPSMSPRSQDLPRPGAASKGTIGLLLMRSYLLAGNTAHYDGVIAALEARGLQVIPAFATGLDARPAIEQYFLRDGQPVIDALVSLTGFSLVGGPAYNDAKGAEAVLAKLDVPYLACLPVEFQSLQEWQSSERGLLPVETTMMVAIPELDGATGSMVFGGRTPVPDTPGTHDMRPDVERCQALAARIERLVSLRRKERYRRRVAIVLFNFPPNSGAVGTAAFLSVFESLHALMMAMQAQGYDVEVPPSPQALRDRLLGGNATQYGTAANVHAHIAVDDHVRREVHLAEIEAQWGPAPGRHQCDGAGLQVLGERFGEVFIGVQPAFGIEGDPMRLLFEKGFAPTHAFCAFYRWLREDFGADVVLHFGTHGALEFMPGKQAGLSGRCWPERLMGDLPNVYLYASNNPSEGSLAKRRSAATLVSYLTPPITEAGLYKGLLDLKTSLERWRGLAPQAQHEREALAALVQAQAAELGLAQAEPPWSSEADDRIARLTLEVHELQTSLIPHGLHVLGRPPSRAARLDMLAAMAQADGRAEIPRDRLEALVDAQDTLPAWPGASAEQQALLAQLHEADRAWCGPHEIDGLLRALDGRFIRPAPGGDVLRNAEVLPTGRNLHGFDPFRIPSPYAMRDGLAQAERLLQRHLDDGHAFPETIAMVLWGSDNLKSEGGPIAQALALMGAQPRFDSYGRLAGATLVPLDVLGRPRVDVVITLSGIFRDLLPLQIRLLAEAAYLAASADEPEELNFVRKHSLAHMAAHGVDLETASLRVFGNAEGAYGANVNHLVDASCWSDEDELAEAFSRRKGYAYGRNGRAQAQGALLHSVLAGVELAYQNLDSIEVGVTTIDTYFDTLGGISRAVRRARGGDAPSAPIYIGDQTRGAGTVRTLSEQVALETRTRTLNPKWYEGMLDHGYEGVRQIEAHITNTFAWSATTGQVQPWVYQHLTQTFILDPEMRDRLARLNPAASAKVATRLLEACERRYWTPDPGTLEALRQAGEELEDRLEGIFEGAPA